MSGEMGRTPTVENSLRCTGDESCPKPWHWQEGVHTAGFVKGRTLSRCCGGRAADVECSCGHCAWHHGRPPEDFRKGGCVVWNCTCTGFEEAHDV